MPVELLAKEATRPGTAPLYRGYAFDLDGTLYLGDNLIEGADIVVAALRASGARVVFVTNKPLETADALRGEADQAGHPGSGRRRDLRARRADPVPDRPSPGARILAVGEPVLIESLRRAGFTLTENPAETDVVVVSFDRTFDYDKLTRAYQAVNAGAVIVATNPDPYCPTPDGGLPDCAAMLAAIEACTGGRAEAIVGKPSVHMANAFLDRLGVPANEAVMVGDRLLTDVAMGLNAGMASALVMSGATTDEHLAASTIHPTHVLDDVRGLIAA